MPQISLDPYLLLVGPTPWSTSLPSRVGCADFTPESQETGCLQGTSAPETWKARFWYWQQGYVPGQTSPWESRFGSVTHAWSSCLLHACVDVTSLLNYTSFWWFSQIQRMNFVHIEPSFESCRKKKVSEPLKVFIPNRKWNFGAFTTSCFAKTCRRCCNRKVSSYHQNFLKSFCSAFFTHEQDMGSLCQKERRSPGLLWDGITSQPSYRWDTLCICKRTTAVILKRNELLFLKKRVFLYIIKLSRYLDYCEILTCCNPCVGIFL